MVLIAGVLLLMALTQLNGSNLANAGPAPRPDRFPGGTWSYGSKQAFGTAYTYGVFGDQNPSRVWFTVARGALTETYYPTIDTANLKVLKFYVTDGRTFTDDEQAADVAISRPDPRALAYHIVTRSLEHGWSLEKDLIADPARNTVLMRVSFDPGPHHARLFLYVVPQIANTGAGQTAFWQDGMFLAEARNTGLAVATTAPVAQYTVGFAGFSDGLGELEEKHHLGTRYDRAENGRVAGMLDLGAPARPFLVGVGFGPDAQAASGTARATLGAGWDATWEQYTSGWHGYLAGLPDPWASGRLADLNQRARDLYWASVMIIKAAEDKTNVGAIIAAPSHPWGTEAPDSPELHGYAFVWPRDLYHAAMALLAAGDRRTPMEVLQWLIAAQRPDGSFPQNANVDGRAHWQSLQMDEVADPILLAWHLREQLTPEALAMVERAAAFIRANGPITPQERWEEASGYSPATIASEIAALAAAADLSARAGHQDEAARDLQLADEWARNVDKWTFTRNGPLAATGYYLRIAPSGDPNTDDLLAIANGGGVYDQREIVDPSFLELVRLGIKAPGDQHILDTLPVVDSLWVVTPHGPASYRYTHDCYGDADPGTNHRRGRLWPIFTGERAMYYLARGDRARAVSLAQAMVAFAGPAGILPEQVWESTGTGTESATPLIWTHAEYVVLVNSLAAGQPTDRPAVAYQRYAERDRSATP